MSGAIGSVQLKKLPNFLKNMNGQKCENFETLFENEENILIQKETHVSLVALGFSLILKNNLMVLEISLN